MPDSADPIETVRGAIRTAFASPDVARQNGGRRRVLVALSGGRDSMALLDALHELADELSLALSAAHVHHGLSAHADAWAAFCANACAARNVPLAVHRVRVVRAGGESLEAAARAARYAALAASDADLLALAHHADDQAETMLLQLMRGAGPPGLAGMPLHRLPAAGPALFRPLLSVPRSVIDAYARARGLAFVDDESNVDTGMRRNFIRHEIAPRLAAAFPGYPATLVRAAAHQADASRLADDLARLDAANAITTDANRRALLDRGSLIALFRRAPYRARNLLRWFIVEHGLRTPSAARLAVMLDQLVNAAADSRVRLPHDGVEIGFLSPAHRRPPAGGAAIPHPVAWPARARAPSRHARVHRLQRRRRRLCGARRSRRQRAATRGRRAHAPRARPAAARPQEHPAGCRNAVLAARIAAARILRGVPRGRSGCRGGHRVPGAGRHTWLLDPLVQSRVTPLLSSATQLGAGAEAA
jgi:tRNA(Ile)-lysidine synthase